MDLYGPLLGPKNYIQMEENWLSAYNILEVLKAQIQFVLSETYLREPHCCSLLSCAPLAGWQRVVDVSIS